jgi:hypothetical protein
MVLKILKIGTTFSVDTPLDSEGILNNNLGKSRSVFAFRKLIKIDRNRLTIQEFSW